MDRYDRAFSSLYLYSGRLDAPNGYYIYGDFTITTWVKILNLVDKDSVFFKFEVNTKSANLGWNKNLQPYYGNNGVVKHSTMSLNINQWQHLAFTMQGTTFSIYIDGRPVYNDTATIINYELQSKVYFGGLTNNPFALFDDIRIFNKSLNQAEIISCSLIYL